MFDNSVQNIKAPQKEDNHNSVDQIFKDAQKLLEKTLKVFEDFNQNIYA